jgi:NAD(P)-dependent dehydrogenase (short-subunit alcohol dehydrogenase family)
MSSDRFKGKGVLISGGAGGLGSEIARRFVAEGANIGIMDTNEVAIQTLVSELSNTGAKVAGAKVDVRDSQDVTKAVDQLAKNIGTVDILVAAAGGSLGTPRDLDDISDDDFDLVIDVNVKGTFNCARAVIPHLKKSNGGSIITFSSIGGRSASPVTGVPYATAKAAILGLTRRLAKEVGEFNIRVNAIAPGLFLTDRLEGMFEKMSKSEQDEVINAIPLKRMPRLQECVEPVLFLASNESSYITGTVLDVNGGRLMAN